MMAEAHAKLDGRPGVCLVTRGPGACNAAIGVHTAFQDSTPMLLLVGQVERGFIGREAFQEVDFTAMFRPLAKFVRQIERTADLPEAIGRSVSLRLFRAAGAGGPGAAGGRAGRTGGGRRCAAAGARPAAARPRPDGAAAPGAGRCPPAGDAAGRRRLVGSGARRHPGLRRSQRACPPAAAFAATTSSTTTTPAMPASWASAPTRHWSSASARPTCCWRSAPGWARPPARATPCRSVLAIAADRSWCMSIPTRTNRAGSFRQRWRFRQRRRSSPRQRAG